LETWSIVFEHLDSLYLPTQAAVFGKTFKNLNPGICYNTAPFYAPLKEFL